MTFGTKLKALRLEHELTQSQLAKKLDTSKSNISKYESDTIEPSMKTLVMISKYFNVSTDYLLGNTIKISPHKLDGSLSSNDKSLLEYFHKIQGGSISENDKTMVTKFFPYAVVLQPEEQDLLEYYNELSKKNRRWIMGQIIDLIKRADEQDSTNLKAQ